MANDRLEIKFAIPKHTHNSRDFHDKLGIFEFDEGIKISFEGSANETLNGIKYNSERIPIYRSWVKEEVNKLQEVIEDFEYDWNQSNDGLIIKDIPDALKDEIFKKAPNEIEDEIKEIIEKQAEIKKIDEYVDPFLIINDKKYNFQIGIRKNFIEKKCGYLELATGTGKTSIAMAILAELFNDDKIDKAIIITPGNELTSQWIEDYLDRFISTRQVANYLLYTVDNKTKNRRKEILSFLGASTTKYKHIMISNGSDYEEIVKLCQDHKSNKIILIHDEVHDLATPNKMMLTEGLHKVFEYRLGLSATIENDFSNEKKDFIEKEIGPVLKNIN